uniref:CUB domain-containing protein n=1 Tax=Syphacia muris TaxID=451379 RepID=A0A0N5AGP5_9BILA
MAVLLLPEHNVYKLHAPHNSGFRRHSSRRLYDSARQRQFQRNDVLTTLKENYTAVGELKPVITADKCNIVVKNYYPEGMHAVFHRSVEFLISNPLVQVQFSPFNISTLPATNDTSKLDCYTSLYIADPDVSSLTIRNWTFDSSDTKVTLIPGFNSIYLNNSQEYDELSHISIDVKKDEIHSLDGLVITTPRINIINSENGTVSFTIYEVKDCLHQMKMVNEPNSGYFIGSYPNYAELELISENGEEISASFTITSSLSNVSRLTLTDGADGNDGHSYAGELREEQVTVKGKQINLKFSPNDFSSSFLIARYATVNGKFV